VHEEIELRNISAQCIAEQSISYRSKCLKGSAIAQAVSHRPPTAAARVGARAGFLRVLMFPLPILIPPIAPQSSSLGQVQ
jgi:hypothetical protein